MMFEGKHIHFSPVNKKPLCSYSAKLCKQRRINGYAFCIRHILEDKSAPFKQCAHVARYNKQKCTNPIPSNENREFCNSHMQVAGMLPKKERKIKKEKDKDIFLPEEGKLKFSDRLKALLTKENSVTSNEDLFNSDDPYAFPDSTSETENSSIGYSATPILRNAWNCSMKNSPETSLDSPTRCDQASKNSISADNKLKNSAPTLSKTMNRLHAKIAQNKLLDKQKKIQDASQVPTLLANMHLQSVKSEPMDMVSVHSLSGDGKIDTDPIKTEVFIKVEPSEDNIKSEDSVSVPSPPSVSQADSHLSCCSSEKYFCKSPTPSDISSKDRTKMQRISLSESSRIPLVLRKLQRIFKNRKKKSKYIFSPSFDASESESSDSEGENNLFTKLSGFCAWDRRSSSSLLNMPFDSRPVQHAQLKSELLRSYNQLCQLHSLHRQERKHHLDVVQPFIEAARAYPNQTSELLMSHIKPPIKQKKIIKPSTSNEKKKCSFKHDDVPCTNAALPYTWHCKKHIMYNVDQLLFEHCTAKFSDNTQCCVPVFDVCHELPLCFEHAKKRDNYNKMASEPKPKKPRKKPKPSALTRPPKRGKKKKKSVSVHPASPVSPSLAASIDSHMDMSSVNAFTNSSTKSEPILPVPELNKELNGELHPELESDLEDFSPGAIEKTLDLPLDTAELANQASKLLEEHDFTEVLNKIPDDAFNDLFVDTRNGDYIPTREETEELERALEAVSKDVHLARESLAKLSSSTTGPDLEELERTIEIHGSLLGAENLTSAIDESSFAELSSNHMDSLNVISSSFSTSDLNSLTQALSAMNSESLDATPVSDGSVPLSSSDLSHPQLLNGHSDVLHSLQLDPAFSSSLMNPVHADNKLFANGSLLSTVLYNIGQTPVAPGNNASEEVASSNHWLLNSPDILALSHLAYQNGFLMTPSMGSANCPSTILGKCSIPEFGTEISLNSNDCPSATSAIVCNTENVIHATAEQPIHGIPSRSATSLQSTNSVKVMVQEGAS